MVAGQLELKTCLSHPVATDLPGAKSEPAGANICDNATAWTGLPLSCYPILLFFFSVKFEIFWTDLACMENFFEGS